MYLYIAKIDENVKYDNMTDIEYICMEGKGSRNFFFSFFQSIAETNSDKKNSPQIFWTKRAIFLPNSATNLSKNNDFANSVHLNVNMASY